MKHDRSAYSHGCRCDICTEANRLYCMQLRLRLVEHEPPEHGTMNGYRNYSCRCDQCKAAGSAANREQYLRRKARR